MAVLEEIRFSVEQLVTAVSDALRLEIAIFDSNSGLFFGTPVYLKKKGRMVHAPSIRDVIENVSLLVNKPGEMPSCIGCRFKEHCPSTIEILCCIHAGTEVAGVISFTSFTKEGQRRITDHTPVYLNAITEISNMIGDLLLNKSGDGGAFHLDATLGMALEICGQPLLLTDAHGLIIQYNQMASELFRVCDIAGTSLWQLFPESVVRRIMDGIDLFEKKVPMGKNSVKITTKTVQIDGQINGFLIRLSGELYELETDTGFFGNIVGASPQIDAVHRLIKKVADSPTPVLITGETGTGKELVARAIHEQSSRKKYPFVAINCSSIPETLFESELFGYEEGSFTGAKKGGKIGKIEMAQGGTLFLDEVGEMPLSVQPKLLRVLQEYELERVGSNKKVHLDIRIVAATNRPLEEMVKARTFRDDLYYRINVINVVLPPLRVRKGDILPIANSYLERLRNKIKTPLKSFSPEAEELLTAYPWPGNVRELQNVLEYAANLCETDVLMPEDLPGFVCNFAAGQKKEMSGTLAAALPIAPSALDVPLSAGGARTALKPPKAKEMETLSALLETFGYTLEGKKQVASRLGISLRTLYRRIKLLEEGQTGAFSET